MSHPLTNSPLLHFHSFAGPYLLDFVTVVHEQQIRAADQSTEPYDAAVVAVQQERYHRHIRYLVLADDGENTAEIEEEEEKCGENNV